MSTNPELPPWAKLIRDQIPFAIGAVGLIREIFIPGPERVFILGACLTCMGVSIWWNRDEKKESAKPVEPPKEGAES